LLQINEKNTIRGLITGNQDHFGLFLTYEEGGYQGTGYYNGNIASMKTTVSIGWPDIGMWDTRIYYFNYDNTNRISNAYEYGFPGPDLGSDTNLTFTQSYFYDEHGNFDTLQQNDTSHIYSYYPNTNRLEKVSNWAQQKDSNYVYDGCGNVVKDNSKNIKKMIYDHRNLIKEVWIGNKDGYIFDYDASGKRISKIVGHTGYLAGNANGDNRVSVSDVVYSINYLFKGGPTPEPLWTADVNGDGGVSVSDIVYLINYLFKGGPAPERSPILTYEHQDKTYYVYSGDNVIAEYDSSQVLTSKHIYAGSERIASRNSNQLRFYLDDHLGSTRMMVDSAGNVSARYSYAPFGQEIESWVSVGTKYKFTGKEHDNEEINGTKTNLYYFGARYYDPKIGRWISVDPRSEKYPSFSPYVYSLDNPVVLLDRDGREVIYYYGPTNNPMQAKQIMEYRERIMRAVQSLPNAGRFLGERGRDTRIVIRGPIIVPEGAEACVWPEATGWTGLGKKRLFKSEIRLGKDVFDPNPNDNKLKIDLQHEFTHVLQYLEEDVISDVKAYESTLDYIEALHSASPKEIEDWRYYQLLREYQKELEKARAKEADEQEQPPPKEKKDKKHYEDLFHEDKLWDITD
jgi:RHS repeat-associated protein